MKCKATRRDAAKLMMDGVEAMSCLEAAGIRVDTGYLDSQIEAVSGQIRDMTKELKGAKEYRLWRRKFGDKTQLGNKVQLGSIVFDDLGFRRKKTPDNKSDGEEHKDKNNEAAFAHVDLPFVKLYFRKEKHRKLLGTYLKGIRREMQDGYLHPFFDLHKVITYRSSSSRPNFQNIPSRNKEIMEIIRRCFIPRKGRHLVEIDYSGVEVRVSACYNKDRALIKYINDSTTDMHRDMAAKLFFMDQAFLIANKDWAKKLVRDWAKNRWVFPQFYGSVFFQCAPHIWEAINEGHKMPDGTLILDHMRKHGVHELGKCEPDSEPKAGTFEAHCKSVEDYMWQEVFHEFTAWKKKYYAAYLKTGYIDMHTGFRCEGLFKRNEVLNFAIQGSSSHCLLQSVVWALKAIKKRKMKSLLMATIHDCSVADVPASELQDYLSLIYDISTRKLMEAWRWINVPLDVECEVCPLEESWNMKKQWVKKDGTWSKA